MVRKITNSKLKKFTSIDEKIAALLKEKENQRNDLALTIGTYFLENFDMNDFEDVQEIYDILDQAVELSDNNISKKFPKEETIDEEKTISIEKSDVNER